MIRIEKVMRLTHTYSRVLLFLFKLLSVECSAQLCLLHLHQLQYGHAFLHCFVAFKDLWTKKANLTDLLNEAFVHTLRCLPADGRQVRPRQVQLLYQVELVLLKLLH